jgi:hypothetical protein
VKPIGNVLEFASRLVRPPQPDAPPTPLVIAIPSAAGQPPLYLTPQEIAAVGGRQVTNPHTGVRVWQLGLWQERGEWIYSPFHDPADLDGSRYRAALAALRQRHRDEEKRLEGRPSRPVRRIDE